MSAAKTVIDSFEIIVIRFVHRFAYYNIQIILYSVPRALISQIYYVYVNGLLNLKNVGTYRHFSGFLQIFQLYYYIL